MNIATNIDALLYGENAESIAIRISSLSVSYGGKPALRDVSLDAYLGHITALIGPSGCGKSTLLMCLNRLLDLVPGASHQGKILIGGQDVLSPQTDVLELRRVVGMVFQKPNPFPFSIRRNFDLALAETGLSKAQRGSRMIECLNAVGLYDEVKDRLDVSAMKLSGGQQQRLCIARALATKPKILLLDEPCSALDPISTMAIERLLLDLKEHITVVIVTHNLSQARRIADDCALFWCEEGAGRLHESGTMVDIACQPRSSITADYIHGRVA
ncbi:hypothetical protein N185_17685 [Sinorhizobium sp. GW3]|nr:hypothetical protein N185_17685 [Sinorhizobium sp. GW3]